jgi:hypothetical protein
LSRESRKASGRLGSGVAAYRETHAAGDRVNPAYSFALFIWWCQPSLGTIRDQSGRLCCDLRFMGDNLVVSFARPGGNTTGGTTHADAQSGGEEVKRASWGTYALIV